MGQADYSLQYLSFQSRQKYALFSYVCTGFKSHHWLAEIPAPDGSQEVMSNVWDSLGISHFNNSLVQDGSSSHSASTSRALQAQI